MDRKTSAIAAILLVAGALGGLLLLTGPDAPDDTGAGPSAEASGSPESGEKADSGRESRPPPLRPGNPPGAGVPRESAAQIQVRVVDEKREPIRDAVLRAGPGLKPARVDATGSASVESPEGILETLIASAPGFAARTFRRIPAGSGLLAILSPVTRFTGVVRDPAGEPLEGAIVKLIPVARQDVEPREQPTGERGLFAIDGLAPGRYDVAVSREGFATRHDLDAVIPAGGLVREYTLAEGSELVIQVREADAKRIVSGAIVRASWTPAAAGTTRHLREVRGPYISDVDGLVRIPGLAAGKVVITGRATGYGATLLPVDVPPDGRQREQTVLYLPRPLLIEGMVERPDGAPAPGSKIVFQVDGLDMQTWEDLAGFAFSAEPFSDEAGRQWPTVRTDGSARFRIAGLPPIGSIRLRAFDPAGRFAPSMQRAFNLRRTPPREPVVFTLAESRTVRGSVLDGTGAPVFDAVVESGGHRTRTSVDGTYALAAVDAEGTVLSASHPGFAPAHIEIGPDATAAPPIVMERGACVLGIAVDEHGSPIFGAWVHARIPGGSARTDSTDSEGRFALGGLHPGEVHLHIHAAGFQDAEFENVAAGGVPIVIRLTSMRPLAAGSISFEVVDFSTGAAVAGVEVSAAGIRQIEREGSRFRLRNASPGFHGFRVSAPGYATQALQGISVAEGEEVELNPVRLERLGSLAVTVTVEGRLPARPAYSVSLVRRGGSLDARVGSPRFEQQNHTAVLRFRDLPPGTYDLTLDIGGGRASASFILEPGRETTTSLHIGKP